MQQPRLNPGAVRVRRQPRLTLDAHFRAVATETPRRWWRRRPSSLGRCRRRRRGCSWGAGALGVGAVQRRLDAVGLRERLADRVEQSDARIAPWSTDTPSRPAPTVDQKGSASTSRFLHERADLFLFGGGQPLQREGRRPHGAFVEADTAVDAPPPGSPPARRRRSSRLSAARSPPGSTRPPRSPQTARPARRARARSHDRDPGRLDHPGRGRVPGVWRHERIAGHVQRTQRGGVFL